MLFFPPSFMARSGFLDDKNSALRLLGAFQHPAVRVHHDPLDFIRLAGIADEPETPADRIVVETQPYVFECFSAIAPIIDQFVHCLVLLKFVF